MKHLFNNLSRDEIKDILTKHSGGKKIDNSKFSKLVEHKLGDIKPMLNEQSQSKKACTLWTDGNFKQGDGVKSPKIVINKSETLFTATYYGPDIAGCIQSATGDNDTVHQLATIAIMYELSPYLKQLYRQGKFVKPDLKSITMPGVPNKSWTINVPLIEVPEYEAITNINRRGSMGGDPTTQFKGFFSTIVNDPNVTNLQEVTVKGRGITEMIAMWRNIKDFPIQTQQSSSQSNVDKSQQVSTTQPIQVTSDNFTSFNEQIRQETYLKSLNLNSVKLDTENFTFSVDLGNTLVHRLSLFVEPGSVDSDEAGNEESQQTLKDRIENTKIKNEEDFDVEELKSGYSLHKVTGDYGKMKNIRYYFTLLALKPKVKTNESARKY